MWSRSIVKKGDIVCVLIRCRMVKTPLTNLFPKADAVIADKKAQLATLDEYKKSLIFEYVTGKKEVI